MDIQVSEEFVDMQLYNLPAELPVILFDIGSYIETEMPVSKMETEVPDIKRERRIKTKVPVERREKRKTEVPVKRRGRPRRPLLQILPTPSDYPLLPLEDAKYLINRVRRSETSCRYRRNASTRLEKSEQRCERLKARNRKLKKMYSKLDRDIQSLGQIILLGTSCEIKV